MSEPQRSQPASAPSRTHWVLWIAVLAILILGTAARLSFYGDPRLAIATIDTQSYIDSSRAPLFSWKDFTGRRLFTTNLVFRLISGNAHCGQIPVSMPAVGKEARRAIVPCFETVAVLQTVLSVAAWVWLAFVVSRRLTEPAAKLLSAIVIMLFAFTPQIAEWDSILGSESLSLSLLILSLGCLIELAFTMTNAGTTSRVYRTALHVLWFISFALWLFVRDANLWAIPATLLLLVPVVLSRRIESKRAVLILAGLLIVLFVWGLLTSRRSTRWPPSIQHSLETFIFPYPARMQFMTERFSMPDPRSAAYPSWFESRAPTAFSVFLALHPGFIVTTIADNWIVFTNSYEQPYYQPEDEGARATLLQLGEALHPASGVFYLVDTLALIAFCLAALAGRRREVLAWTWLLAWLYLAAVLTLLLSYFGDTDGVMRHIVPSLEMFRLLMWLSLLILMDAYLRHSRSPAPQPATISGSAVGG